MIKDGGSNAELMPATFPPMLLTNRNWKRLLLPKNQSIAEAVNRQSTVMAAVRRDSVLARGFLA
jgi:hypothetical protein